MDRKAFDWFSPIYSPLLSPSAWQKVTLFLKKIKATLQNLGFGVSLLVICYFAVAYAVVYVVESPPELLEALKVTTA